jgi:hypothetical protein
LRRLWAPLDAREVAPGPAAGPHEAALLEVVGRAGPEQHAPCGTRAQEPVLHGGGIVGRQHGHVAGALLLEHQALGGRVVRERAVAVEVVGEQVREQRDAGGPPDAARPPELEGRH